MPWSEKSVCDQALDVLAKRLVKPLAQAVRYPFKTGILAKLPHPYFFGIDDDEFVERAAALHDDYMGAHPFLNCVIDDFLPEVYAEEILEHFPPPDRFTHLSLQSVRANKNQPMKLGVRST